MAQLVELAAGRSSGACDPVETALRWQRAGAAWVHLVDLDAAFGRGANRVVLADVVAALDIDVELSGGIIDDESLGAALRTGCRRVVLATTALERPQWCAAVIAAHGDRIAVSLDLRGTTLAPRGGSRTGGSMYDALTTLESAGCARYVVTDVSKDGTLQGPNLELLRHVCEHTEAPVIASGGVSTLADLVLLAELVALGVEGAIVGTALYTGAVDLTQALAAVAEASSGAGAAGG